MFAVLFFDGTFFEAGDSELSTRSAEGDVSIAVGGEIEKCS